MYMLYRWTVCMWNFGSELWFVPAIYSAFIFYSTKKKTSNICLWYVLSSALCMQPHKWQKKRKWKYSLYVRRICVVEHFDLLPRAIEGKQLWCVCVYEICSYCTMHVTWVFVHRKEIHFLIQSVWLFSDHCNLCKEVTFTFILEILFLDNEIANDLVI